MKHLTDILTEGILDVDANSDRLDDLVDAKLLFDNLASLTKKNYGGYKNDNQYIGTTDARWSRKQRFANTDLLGKTIKKGDLVLVLRDLPIHEADYDHAYGIVADIKNGEYVVLCGISPKRYNNMEIQKHYDESTLTTDMIKNAALGYTFKGWEIIRIADKKQFDKALSKIKM